MKDFEYPENLIPQFKKAKKIEWISIIYLVTTVILMYVTMGNSQTMKTAWLEDFLSLTPPISFLIASSLFFKPKSKNFPFGYHRVVSIAYLCSALALFVVGGYLLIDSSIKLIKTEHPAIGSVVIFGHQFWLGYLMIISLAYGTIPSVFFGIKKIPLAKDLHEKNLFTDAQMNKADWMSGSAAIAGMFAVGLGWWWADSAAAIIISFDIIHDGFRNVKQALFDLMNQIPKTIDHSKDDLLLKKIDTIFKNESWIKEFKIRIREEGHIFFGEAFVIPKTQKDLLDNMENTVKKVQDLNWLLFDFHIIPVKVIEK